MNNLPHYDRLEISQQYVTPRFFIVEMKYVPHSFVCDLKQAVMLLEILNELHQKYIVHGDIRRSNILFSIDSCAYFIDFDLSGKENERYPECYNHIGIIERHPKAQAHNKRKKEHDIHSLYHVINSTAVHFTFAQKETLQKLKKEFSLDEIIAEMKEC